MIKVLARLGLFSMLVLGLVTTAAAAEEVNLDGKIVCAKCMLKRADAKECQNVLVVTDEDGKDVEYYVTKNAVDAEFGEVCMEVKKVTVTGTMAEKDGRRWITASKIERVKS